jgi:hypothetical protein
MKSMLAVLLSIALTAVCWGVYGPVLHQGRHGMGVEVEGKHVDAGPWRPFTCVGLAYFGIAVVAPALMLRTRGENGKWTISGTIWSLAAGAAGAAGALGIIMAFENRGNPIYVMPLVFGGAPLVNVLYTMYMHPPKTAVNPLLYVGFLVTALGAGMVLYFKPPAH